MTMAEKKMNSIQKEIEKLEKSLARYKGLLEKKVAKCEKLNCNWTREEMFDKREKGEMSQEQWSAYFDRIIEESHVEDTEDRLNNAGKRFSKAVEEYEKVATKEAEDEEINAKELQWLENSQKHEDEYYVWLNQFRKECAKDGILIDKATNAYLYGHTASGKEFSMYINDGFTLRSLHSYTLRVNGVVLFTSGLFSTGYKYLKKH